MKKMVPETKPSLGEKLRLGKKTTTQKSYPVADLFSYVTAILNELFRLCKVS